jgi:hypothetical protein
MSLSLLADAVGTTVAANQCGGRDDDAAILREDDERLSAISRRAHHEATGTGVTKPVGIKLSQTTFKDKGDEMKRTREHAAIATGVFFQFGER